MAPSLMELARRWRPRQSENAEIEQLRIRLERTTRQLKYAREVAASLSARVAARGLSEQLGLSSMRCSMRKEYPTFAGLG